MLLLLLLSFVLESSQQPADGFDWGEGCPKGTGEPFYVDLKKENTTSVGIIPKGKFGVWVLLESEEDLDIQLWDTNGKRPIVRYADCTNKTDAECGLGVLGNNAEEMNATYVGLDGSSIKIGYSGYNGVKGQGAGHEWIEIYGESNVDIEVMAYAFSDGRGYIKYAWGHSQTPCCLGTQACTGTFVREIRSDVGEYGEITVVGEIPPGVRDLSVYLNSNVDIDIQLYDLSDTERWNPAGRAIIGWCPVVEDKLCNIGWINGPQKEYIGYPAFPVNSTRNYYYSGYNGVSGAGEEYIRIEGFTNRRLLMSAFAYKSGFANVSYSYYQPLYVEGVLVVPEPLRCLGEREYSMEFQYQWEESTHPIAYPFRPAWSSVVASTHSLGFKMWSPEFYASQGLKMLADTGSIDEVRGEASRSLSVFKTAILEELLEGVGQRSGTITVNEDYSLFSAVVKARPSPDWFSGVRDVELCQDGKWVDSVSLPLRLFDAGTNTGTAYADRGAPDSQPITVVDQDTGVPFSEDLFQVPSYGQVVLTRKVANRRLTVARKIANRR